MATSPEPTTPLRKMSDEILMTSASTETEEAVIYHHHDQQHPVLPPYSTLYNQHPAPSTYGSAPSYHHQEVTYSGPPVESGYYALMGTNSANVGATGQPGFHQHSFSSSVRAW